MGLFSSLFGRKPAQFTERIWLNTERKLADLIARMQADRAAGVCPVVIAHFRTTHALLTKVFEQAGIPGHVVSGAPYPVRIPSEWQSRTVLLLSPEAPVSRETLATYAQPKNMQLPPMAIHLAEHYPLPWRDQQVLDLDQAWPMPLTFTCYTGLNEAWLQPFGVERVTGILKQLKMPDDEVLEHEWLNKSMRSAQEKLAKHVTGEQRCDDCAQWMRINYRAQG